MAHSVVVGVDDAVGSGAAVDWAADEARARGTGLHLVQAWEWEGEGSGSLDAALVREADEQTLGTLVGRASARHPELAVSSAVVEAAPREALTSLADEVDLLVVGSRGLGGFPGLLTGSTSLYVAAHAACPVVVIPRTEAATAEGATGGEATAEGATGGGVAVGLHPREGNDRVLAFAFDEARRRGLPLRAVQAWSYPLIRLSGRAATPVYEAGDVEEEQVRRADEILAGWRERYPDVPVQVDVVRTSAAKHLVTLSGTQRLVVVGRHGNPGGPVRRLGSVSQAVVQHAACPVAVVPLG